MIRYLVGTYIYMLSSVEFHDDVRGPILEVALLVFGASELPSDCSLSPSSVSSQCSTHVALASTASANSSSVM